jgi:hypothetical protein
VGTWTWLRRLRAEDLAVLLADPDPGERAHNVCAGIDPDIRPVEEIDTHRAWHALHVVLTGRESGGDPPASYVVEDGTIRIDPDYEPGDLTLLTPPDVRAVAEYLATVPFDALVTQRHPRMRADGDLSVYSFDIWDGQDMVECGLLRRVFDDLTRFYRDAAAAGDAVMKDRG